MDEFGRLRGVLTRDTMIKALQEHGPDTPVLEVMETDIPTVPARAKLDTAVRLLTEKELPVVSIRMRKGALSGC